MFGFPMPEYLRTRMDEPQDVLRELLVNPQHAKSTPQALVKYAFDVASEFKKQRAAWKKTEEKEKYRRIAVESGALMKEERKRQKLSIADLAAAVDSTSMAIARYEKGAMIPASQLAQRIKEKLKVNALWGDLYYRDRDLIVGEPKQGKERGTR